MSDNIINSASEIPNAPIYVCMTDGFMSNWGKAEGKSNRLIFVCKDSDEAVTVERNARNRDEMKYISICHTKPRVNPNNCTQLITKDVYPNWYKVGYFARRA